MAIITWQKLVKEEFKETNVLRVLRKTFVVLPVELQQIISIEYEVTVFKARIKTCQNAHIILRAVFLELLGEDDDVEGIAIMKLPAAFMHAFEYYHIQARFYLLCLMQLKKGWGWRQTANFPDCNEKHVTCARGSDCAVYSVSIVN